MRLTKIMHENKIHQKIHNDTYFTKNETYKNNSTKQKMRLTKISTKARHKKMVHKNETHKNDSQKLLTKLHLQK